MPDLGKYAVQVLSAYGVSFVLFAGLLALSFWRSARVKKTLAEAEARRDKNGS